MDEHDRNRNAGVIVGAVLIALGGFYIVARVAGPLIGPLRSALDFLWSIGWPLALVGLGVLLIVRRDALLPKDGVEGKRLYRSRSDKMVSGVLGGLAVYLGVDSTWVRIGFALLGVVSGFGPALIAYIIASVIVPEESVVREDGAKPPAAPPIPRPPAN